MQCPLTLEFACKFTVLSGGMVTFCVVWTGPLMSSRQNCLTSRGSLFVEGWPIPSPISVLSELVWVSCSAPDMTVPKWACLQVVVTFASSPFVIKLRALSMILDPTTTRNRSWLGWPAAAHPHYSLPSTNPRYGMAAPPVPSSSNNWPNGWICSMSSSQNWKLTLDTWAPKLISAVFSCPSTITGALVEHPTRWAMGSGLRNGTGATSSHPFAQPWVWSVLVWGQGWNAGSLLLAIVVGVGRGLGHISSVPPGLV